MTVCATCSRELQPEWKFCIYCGTPTGVPLTAAIEIVRAAAESEDVRAATQAAGGLRTGAIMIVTAPNAPQLAEPVAPVVEHIETPVAPVVEPVETLQPESDPESDAETAAEFSDEHHADTGEVLRIEDVPADEPAKPAAVVETAPVAKINILAVLALILGCLASPLAAVFGHLALNQISRTGERGTAIAWVAVVLGYLSLAALLVLGISYFVLNA